MSNRVCVIDRCGRSAKYATGLCRSHERRRVEYGDPLAGPPIRPYSKRSPGASLEDRLWAKAPMPQNPLDCWEWSGALSPGSGYAVIQIEPGKRDYAHRVAYELSIGPIPHEKQIDHICRNRRCVNPLHLEAVTQHENIRRRPDRAVTHCPQGHPYAGDNLYMYKGHRHCKACRADRVKKRAEAA